MTTQKDLECEMEELRLKIIEGSFNLKKPEEVILDSVEIISHEQSINRVER